MGKLALVECIRTGSYDTEKGRFTNYITPFLDGTMRRHLECSIGTLTLDRDSMGLVRKAQRLYHQEEKEPSEIRALTMKCLREEFMQLSKRDQEILGRHFGVYGFPKSDLREIAMRNRIKESGVEKAKNQAMQRLRDRYLDSFSWKLRRARQMIDRLISTETKSFLDPVQ